MGLDSVRRSPRDKMSTFKCRGLLSAVKSSHRRNERDPRLVTTVETDASVEMFLFRKGGDHSSSFCPSPAFYDKLTSALFPNHLVFLTSLNAKRLTALLNNDYTTRNRKKILILGPAS